MIHKKEKELLLQAFEAPKPVKRKAFLRKLPKQEASLGQLVLSQAGYVRKWVWVISVLALFSAAVLTRFLPDKYVWLLSSLSTCVSVSLVAELAKSASYGMSELEASTRLSLRLILLARITAIGIVHIVILLFMIPFIGAETGLEIWQKSVYIAVPYLLTAGLGLDVVRKYFEKDSTFLSIAIGVGVGLLFPGIHVSVLPIYHQEYVMYWTIGAFVLLFWFSKQLKITMYATENLV